MYTRRNFIKTSALGAGLISSSSLSMAYALTDTNNQLTSTKHCLLPSHNIPVIVDVDLLVIGGSTGAVAVASEAAQNGLSVFLVSPLPYLGEDICGTLRLWQDENPSQSMAEKIFRNNVSPMPLHVKTVLEDELITNNINFLYSSYLVDVLYNKNGQISGGLISNRSGCQAICAKMVVDGTLDATFARAAHIPFSGNTSGNQQYEFIVVGNSKKTNEHITEVVELDTLIKVKDKTYKALRYTFSFPDAGNDFDALNRIEQQIRDITWDVDQVDSADLLYYIPSQQVKSKLQAPATGQDIPIQALQPEEHTNFYLLNGYADVSRDVAETMLRPVSLIDLGKKLGKEVALQSGKITKPTYADLNVHTSKAENIKPKAREINSYLRPDFHKGTIQISDIQLPVWGEYDMIVLGGGTAGAPVGISASRQGIKTLTIEYLHGLGGLTTTGLIGRYWDGFREGFTKEIDAGVRNMAPLDHPRQKKNWSVEWPSDWKMEWFRKEIRKAKGNIWFGTIGCGTVTDGKRVCGVVVATPYGRGVVLAKTVVDSTGSADIAIAGGAGYDYTGKHTVAVQGAGLCKRDPNDFYNNNDWTFIDDSDILDVSRVFVAAKAKYKGSYDLCKIPQTRERRRVIAEHNVSVLDVINGRRYPDTLSYHTSSFDTHGFTIDPYFTLKAPEKRHKIYNADVPLRTLLPKGLDGIIVTGLGTGAHRDAMPIIRMQPCLQNQGYAVGYLVATAIKENKSVRQVDIRKIQQYLVSMGNLPDRVLTDKNNFPFSKAQFVEAASKLHNDMEGLEILLTDTKQALPLLKQEFKKKAGTAEQINYAQTLAMLGESVGIQALIDKINSFTEWDKGWAYTGMGQFGPCMSHLDSLIIALGNARKKEALPAIEKLAKQLEAKNTFSHFRAVCMAFESIGDSSSAPLLYEMLHLKDIRNEVVDNYKQARKATNTDWSDTSIRNKVLKELHLARALYRCGDKDTLGETILRRYTNDFHNHYARHAKGVLSN
ncbi:MAG: FAD-dependent oxidoreductase [Bacteroidales bacterium]|jgi:hypothetical protein|nr:FAD-dependent oxidoreductase [Bacteroidales bacterium]